MQPGRQTSGSLARFFMWKETSVSQQLSFALKVSSLAFCLALEESQRAPEIFLREPSKLLARVLPGTWSPHLAAAPLFKENA